jgi:2-hydroxycyclohexanecarboxyl-CoA dehydrogenase
LGPCGRVLDTESAFCQRVFSVNLVGTLNCTHAGGIQLVEANFEGRIVNVASHVGRVGSTGEAVYSGAKAGVVGFTKAITRELAHYDITCTVVPLVEEMLAESELGDLMLSGTPKQIPLDRQGNPEDVAGAVAYLASADASYVTGQVLNVSGDVTTVD